MDAEILAVRAWAILGGWVAWQSSLAILTLWVAAIGLMALLYDWLMEHWRRKAYRDGYSEPGQPRARVVPPPPTPEAVCHSTRYVASTDDLRAADPASEESGYATTSLKLVRRERVH